VARHGADPAALADLEADAARLSALLDDLLALAREDAAAPPPREPVDLVAVAREAAAADPDSNAVVEPGPDEVMVSGDRTALERAAGNLVRNARKHGPRDGVITIAVALERGRARLSVTDEGKGLDPSEAARAFERFWRGPRAAGDGSGLGLPIVRSIAERHDGGVEVDGARFTIDLPALKDLSNPARRTPDVTVIDHQGRTRA
jgi:signal transduction histidine kinase